MLGFDMPEPGSVVVEPGEPELFGFFEPVLAPVMAPAVVSVVDGLVALGAIELCGIDELGAAPSGMVAVEAGGIEDDGIEVEGDGPEGAPAPGEACPAGACANPSLAISSMAAAPIQMDGRDLWLICRLSRERRLGGRRHRVKLASLKLVRAGVAPLFFAELAVGLGVDFFLLRLAHPTRLHRLRGASRGVGGVFLVFDGITSTRSGEILGGQLVAGFGLQLGHTRSSTACISKWKTANRPRRSPFVCGMLRLFVIMAYNQ
ncbi:MAG TPA: hypothetical protein VFC47_00835 [Caulobacteraceae bacterium]|nr:hypothetical protein [Caulobacteraceae bacterium]